MNAILFLCVVVAALGVSSPVIDLTSKNFQKEVLKSDDIIIVEFYRSAWIV